MVMVMMVMLRVEAPSFGEGHRLTANCELTPTLYMEESVSAVHLDANAVDKTR